jgi:hypothetical protein
MKKLFFMLLLATTQAHAQAPWVTDCVKWYGGFIPVEERTDDNCPNLRSHWDTDKEFLAMEDKYAARKDYAMMGLIELIKQSKRLYPEYFNDSRVIAGAGTGGGSAGMSARQVILPNASYQVINSGSTTTVISTAKSK